MVSRIWCVSVVGTMFFFVVIMVVVVVVIVVVVFGRCAFWIWFEFNYMSRTVMANVN